MTKILKFRIELVVFFISATLLILAINSTWTVFMEGQAAARNAEQVLNEFDLLVLKNDPPEIQVTNDYEKEPTEVITDTETEPVEALPLLNEPIKKSLLNYTPIAKIHAQRIGMKVSVLSEWSYELLDISVNKFSGPEPNEEGNFIVIGHNYLNAAHFGSLHLLEIGDRMELTDLTGRKLMYDVYDIQIIRPSELDKLATDQAKTLTLITCHTDNQFRLVVKSKVIND